MTSEAPKVQGRERRVTPRYDVRPFEVQYSNGEHFLFAHIENISELGIFLRSDEPLPIGTRLELSFMGAGGAPLRLDGEVVWVNAVRPLGPNPNPGMGVRFVSYSPEQREAVVAFVRRVAYLRGHLPN